jgi:hypothetical protein
MPSLVGLVLAISPIDVREGYFIIKLECNQNLYCIVKVNEGVNEKAATLLALTVGDMIGIGEHQLHDSYISCKAVDLYKLADDYVMTESPPELTLFPTSSSRQAIHYRGQVTRHLDDFTYEIDNVRRIICSAKLTVGVEYTFYNLEWTTLDGEQVFIYCPLYSSGLDTTFEIISLRDKIRWNKLRSILRESLKGILSASYFSDDGKFERLGQRTVKALITSVDLMNIFGEHCRDGACRACLKGVLTESLSEIGTIGDGTLLAAIVGRIGVCQMTGKLVLDDATGKMNVAIVGRVSLTEYVNVLVIITRGIVISEEIAAGQKCRYLLALNVTVISPLTANVARGDTPMKSDLMVVKHVNVPILLNKSGPMVCAVEAYKFGCITVDGDNGKIEMKKQQLVEILLPAAKIVSAAIQSGTILSGEAIGRLEFVADENLSSKQIRVSKVSEHSLCICCSSVAFEYLKTLQDLLRPTHVEPIALRVALQCTSNLVPLIEATIMKRESSKSYDLNLPNVTIQRSAHFVEYGIGLPGSGYIVLTLQSERYSCSLLLEPNTTQLYPVGLIIGAKVQATNLRVVQLKDGPVLIATLKTTFAIVDYHDVVIAESVSPLKFIYELVMSPIEHLTLQGRFTKFISLDAQLTCAVCQIANCKLHNGSERFDMQCIFQFTDGTADCDIVISELSLLAQIANCGIIKELVRDAPISVRHKREFVSKIDDLYGRLVNYKLFARDYEVKCKMLPAVRFGLIRRQRLQLMSIEPVDYLDQNRKFLTLLESISL